MSQAEDIRKFTYKHYILPARNKNATQVTIRAGDIHSKMRLKSRMPAVCGALGTKIFKDTYNVKLINRRGSTNGANVYFTFKL